MVDDISRKQAIVVILIAIVAIIWIVAHPQKAAAVAKDLPYQKQPWYMAYNYPVLSTGTMETIPPRTSGNSSSNADWMGVLW